MVSYLIKMVRQIILFVLLISVVFGYPVENEPKEEINHMQKMIEKAGLYGGDIMLTEEQRNAIMMKTGLIDEKYRWPNRVVPYELTAGHFSQTEINVILQAMQHIESQTCIRFRQRTANDRDFLRITGRDNGCFSFVGRVGIVGGQQLNLETPGCLWAGPGVAIHEITHALGFFHMHQAYDRDNYIVINWQNINPDYRNAFDKLSTSEASHFGGEYDYYSIMHYGNKDFSINGQETITSRNPNVNVGSLGTLTYGDAKKISNMYKC